MSTRQRVGIEKITAYPCTLVLDMKALAEARGVDPAHPLDELWVDSRSINPVWEDPVTMAVNAALGLLDEEDRAKIELVIVGTESSPDYGKPISTYVQRHCGLGPHVRNFETKHACYGGTSGLMMAAHWVASGVRPGAKALVIATDQSRVHLNKPWEFVLGAASTAMLVSNQPDVFEFELEHNGYWTQEIADTYRPTSRNEVGHAENSLFGYLEAVEGSYGHFMERAGNPDYDAHFAKHIYHVPFGGMTFRAHRALMRLGPERLKQSQIREHFERKSKPSLRYNRRFGGSYTSATFLAMMGLVASSPEMKEGDRVSVFSYGSGSCAEFYPLRLGPKAHEVVAAANLDAGLDARRSMSVPEYEALEMARAEYVDQSNYKVDRTGIKGHYDDVYEGSGRLVLDGVDEWERIYRVS